jgi:dTDP-glucose 4,6-dehydratase
MSKKIAVITGFAGFIGANLTEKLLSEGWYVYGIDKLTYVANKDVIHNLMAKYPARFTWVMKDVVEVDWLPECDVIFNLAAESDVDNGNLNAKNFVSSNIEGVRNLLSLINSRIIIKADKPLFFQMSTDEVYGDTIEGSFNEDSPLYPSNPYSATKAAADLLIQSWSRTHGLEYIIARPSNNYGPYQYPEKLIPISVKRLDRNRKIKLHNEGKPIRTWTHVEDTCDAILTIYEKGKRNSIYNISSEFEQDNLTTVKKILNSYFMGRISVNIPDHDAYIDFSYSRTGQDVRYSITCEPLKSLGWVPKKKFDEEIVTLVNTYKEKGITW